MSDEARMLYLSPEEIRPYQLERLQQTLERSQRTPYFAQRLAGVEVHSLGDLANVPFTLKEDMRAASPFGAVAVPNAELFQ